MSTGTKRSMMLFTVIFTVLAGVLFTSTDTAYAAGAVRPASGENIVVIGNVERPFIRPFFNPFIDEEFFFAEDEPFFFERRPFIDREEFFFNRFEREERPFERKER